MKQLSLPLLLTLISCGQLIPNKIKDAIHMKEGETMLVSGIVTHKIKFGICYYTLADSEHSKDVIYVKCGKTKVNVGEKVSIRITPHDFFELDDLKAREYIEIE